MWNWLEIADKICSQLSVRKNIARIIVEVVIYWTSWDSNSILSLKLYIEKIQSLKPCGFTNRVQRGKNGKWAFESCRYQSRCIVRHTLQHRKSILYIFLQNFLSGALQVECRFRTVFSWALYRHNVIEEGFDDVALSKLDRSKDQNRIIKFCKRGIFSSPKIQVHTLNSEIGTKIIPKLESQKM